MGRSPTHADLRREPTGSELDRHERAESALPHAMRNYRAEMVRSPAPRRSYTAP